LLIGAYRIYTAVPAVRQAVALATTVKPETFTELYFEKPFIFAKHNVYARIINSSLQSTILNKDMNYPTSFYNLNGETNY